MTHASDNSPPKGETVSDESEFEQLVSEEVIACRYLLRRAVKSDVDEEGIALFVKEARARLELLEYRAEREVAE